MLFGAMAALCVASVPLAGGRLSALAAVRFRQMWLLVAALALQVLIISVIPTAPAVILAALHIGTYLLAACFLMANRSIPGLLIVGVGAAMNLLAIAANRGVMPASRAALERAAMLEEMPRTFTNSAAVSRPELGFLGDIFAVPDALPFANVFSVGDVFIVLGVALMLHRICGSRLARTRRAQPSNSAI